jgi:hypothetical protein
VLRCIRTTGRPRAGVLKKVTLREHCRALRLQTVLRPVDVPDHHAVVLGATPSRPSWLRVSKVEVPALPAVPDPLRADLAEYAQKRGDDVEAVRSRRQRWVATVWTDWAQLARRAARQLYQRLYDMRLRLERYSVTHGFETASQDLEDLRAQLNRTRAEIPDGVLAHALTQARENTTTATESPIRPEAGLAAYDSDSLETNL